VLDSLPSGILVCAEKHSLVKANKSALRLLPLAHAEGPLWELIPDENMAAFLQQTLSSSDNVLEHEMNISMQGHKRLLSLSVHPLVDRRRITGSLIYIDDISEKRSREIRLRRAENLASLTTLAAGVAHEIKNPLGAISIHLQLMQKALAGSGNKDGKKQTKPLFDKYFNIINEEIDRLNRIVVDFLFAVRPVTLELREGNLNALIGELADFIRAELDQAGIHLLLELDKKLLPALIDERCMKQALLNIIKNAQAAMPKGGLLTIATLGTDGEIRISVCDTGVGINPENLKKIFEPYFTTRDNGTGLGLTLVYKIIREHQGDISVESREGGGTDFEITLPVYRREQKLIPERTQEAQNEIQTPYR
jgi:signal transduction histidine kinase